MDRPVMAVVYGQPNALSTSFQTSEFSAALSRWFTILPLPVSSRTRPRVLVQWRRFRRNYLQPNFTRRKFPFVFYGNDGMVDLRVWSGHRLLYWYDAPADWSKRPPARRQWIQWLRYQNVLIAESVFCVSHAQQQVAQRLRPGRESTVHYLPVGVDCRRFDPAQADTNWARKQFGLPEKKTIIGYLGYLARYQNRFAGELLAETAPGLLQAHPNIHFLVVGFGPAQREFERRTAELGARQHFTFTGFVANERLPAAIAAMDLAVDTLEAGFHSEARSETKLKQYMAMARACVATDLGENRVDLDGGRCGLLIPPGGEALAQGIGRLISDQNLRSRFGTLAQERARAIYGWPQLAQRLVEALQASQALAIGHGE